MSGFKEKSQKKYLHKIKHHVNKSVNLLQLNKNTNKIIFLSAFLSSFLLTLLFLSGILSIPVLSFRMPYMSSNKLNNEVAVYDPYLLYKSIKKGNGELLIVDLRSEKEFKAGHIRGAINIPQYNDLETYTTEEKINKTKLVNDFKKFNPARKLVIIYGHSQYSKLPKLILEVLTDKNIKAEVLGVGFNEWRHFRNLWLPEAEWNNINIEDIVELQTNSL